MPIKNHKGLVAFGSLVIDDCLYLGSIGVHKRMSGSGYRITYPNKVVGNRNVDIYHPVNKEVSREIERAITDKAEEIFGS